MKSGKVEWLDEVAKAVEFEAKKPKFPGDGSYVLPLLEKLVQKLYGECWNGGEVGKDDCGTCRAHRTEVAEGKLTKVSKDAEAALKKQNELEGKLDKLEKSLNEQDQYIVGATAQSEALKSQLSKTADVLKATKVSEQSALDERAAAQSSAASLTASLTATTNELEKLKKWKARVIVALQDFIKESD